MQRVAANYVHPDTAIVIAAGDRSKIEPELKKLSIGTIELVDYDGNLIEEGTPAVK